MSLMASDSKLWMLEEPVSVGGVRGGGGASNGREERLRATVNPPPLIQALFDPVSPRLGPASGPSDLLQHFPCRQGTEPTD